MSPAPVLKLYAKLLIVLLALLCPSPGMAEGKMVVTWMEAEMPPFLIKSGPNKDQGYGNVITEIIKTGLPQYHHQEMVTNITRHFYKFKQGEQVCSVGLFRTPEREEFMHFSLPSFLTLPAVIIIKKEHYGRFGGKPTVKLDAILADSKLMIGCSKDRSYGQLTDAVLKKYLGRENILTFAGQELSTNLFKMLLLNRLDGLIGLPEEELYQAEQMGIRDQFMTLAIEENLSGYEGWLSSVGCAKTEWGRQVIEEVNRILIKERPGERYRAAYERWLDNNAIEHYRKVYKEVFLTSKP